MAQIPSWWFAVLLNCLWSPGVRVGHTFSSWNCFLHTLITKLLSCYLKLKFFQHWSPPIKWDESIWVYLAQEVLNISYFCLSGGISIKQTFTSCLVGVCTSLYSLWIHTLLQHIKKTIISDIYIWEPVVTLKDREMFSLKVTYVVPVGKCTTFVKCTKNGFMLLANGNELQYHH